MKNKACNSNFETELLTEYIQSECSKYLDLYRPDKSNSWLLPTKPLKIITKCHKQKGHDGKYKNIYITAAEARQKAKDILIKRGISLFEYKCNFCSGWHLSKRH